jgi:hypothetical protein
MPYLSEVYTVGGLILVLFLASRAAVGGGSTEGPSPSMEEVPLCLAATTDEDEEIVAS